jgi:hypothetical protein
MLKKYIYLEAWSTSQNLQTVFNKEYTQVSSLRMFMYIYIYIYIYMCVFAILFGVDIKIHLLWSQSLRRYNVMVHILEFLRHT